MGRPKGSKNKATIEKEKNKLKPIPTIKAKKIVDKHPTRDKIENIKAQKGRPKMPKHVLLLEEPFYITCDACTFILKAVNSKKKPNGEKYPDVSLLYAPHLDNMLQVTANYMVRVPGDVAELGAKLEHIYEMIMDRTSHDRPKDLFKEFDTEEEIAEALEELK